MTDEQAHTTPSNTDISENEISQDIEDRICLLMMNDIVSILYDDGGNSMDDHTRISRIYDVTDNHDLYVEKAWREKYPGDPFYE